MPKPRICQLCNRPKIIEARGLCRQCYGIVQRSGDLDNFIRDQATTFGSEDEIVRLYNDGLLVLDIAKKYKVSKNTIYRTLERFGRKRETRKYNIDETAFDTLDNEPAAYWLGFIYADGYVSPKRSYFNVGLQRRDEDHLDKLKEFLKSDAQLGRYNYTGHPQSRLNISNRKLSDRLRELGIIVGRNRFNLTIEGLPPEMYRHFIRGLIDGDGYVCENNKWPQIRLVGQDDMLDWTNDIIFKTLSIPQQPKKLVNKKDIILCISFAGRTQAAKLGDWIYRDAQVFMQRKCNRYLAWSKENTRTGEQNGNSKLKWNQVNEMRELWLTGKYSKASLGRMFGVTPRMVLLIVNNEVWKVNG